jgi:hypothetical protein
MQISKSKRNHDKSCTPSKRRRKNTYLYKGAYLRVWGLVDLIEDLRQVIFARDDG